MVALHFEGLGVDAACMVAVFPRVCDFKNVPRSDTGEDPIVFARVNDMNELDYLTVIDFKSIITLGGVLELCDPFIGQKEYSVSVYAHHCKWCQRDNGFCQHC